MSDTFNDPFGILTDINYMELLNEFKNIQIIDSNDNITDVDYCKQCGHILYNNIDNISNTCSNCGLVSNESFEESININDIVNNKLRIVGYNSNTFQPNLYKSDHGNLGALQKKQIFNEYKEYRQKYIELGEKAFPLHACIIATEIYNKIQQQCVKRSQNKKAIMAACLWQACLIINFAPSKIEIAKFMQLSRKGIARGNNFIRYMVSEHNLEVDPNRDTIHPEIKTLFLQLNYEDERYNFLYDIIKEIIEISNANSIGINSLPRTKVMGSTYIILRRSINNPILINIPINLKEFCKNKIRKNTIDRFINEINAYHSYFIEYYKSKGLIYTLPLP